MPTLDDGMQLFHAGAFHEAFACFQRLALDVAADRAARADAFNLMGVAVLASPDLGVGDECGLSFYRQALELDPDNLGALLNVVATCGDHIPDHQDLELLQLAISGLERRWGELDATAQASVAAKRVKYLKGV